MSKIVLNTWAGSFDEGEHRYFLGEKELQGITGMIKRMLFPQEYSGVSQEVLQQAAERGHKIHSQVELYDNLGVGTNIPEVANYARLKGEYGLEWIASEYLVSDNENYATAIDKVYHVKDTPDDIVALGDIKTTYNFNREYVSWRNSLPLFLECAINASLDNVYVIFEMKTPISNKAIDVLLLGHREKEYYGLMRLSKSLQKRKRPSTRIS